MITLFARFLTTFSMFTLFIQQFKCKNLTSSLKFNQRQLRYDIEKNSNFLFENEFFPLKRAEHAQPIPSIWINCSSHLVCVIIIIVFISNSLIYCSQTVLLSMERPNSIHKRQSIKLPQSRFVHIVEQQQEKEYFKILLHLTAKRISSAIQMYYILLVGWYRKSAHACAL